MYVLYNTLLVLMTVVCVPLIGTVLLIRRKYRSGFFAKCGICPWSRIRGRLRGRPVWIHAVSVGEVMAAIPLIREIKKNYQGLPVVLSTVTETGNLTAQRNARDVDQVIYFPYDFAFIVTRFIKALNPRCFIAIEAEIWPNLLRELHRRGIPAIIVSGRISQTSSRNYYAFRFFFKRVLSCVARFSMQSRIDADRIIRVGAAPDKVMITGNIKFDQKVPAITPQEKQQLYTDLRISPSRTIFIAGSTHRGEEHVLIEAYTPLKKKFPDLVLILAPRHPERFDEVAMLLRQAGVTYVRKSRFAAAPEHPAADIILLDTIGELAKIYSIGTVVFIGGSLVPVGGHNVLEPAVFSKPVIFGNFMNNFSEISAILTKKHAAVQVDGRESLLAEACRLLGDPDLRHRIGDAAFRVIMENSGAVHKNMEILKEVLNEAAR